MSGRLVSSEDDLAAIVRSMHTVAVLGIKDERSPDAPAHSIPAMLEAEGLDVIGINPRVPVAFGAPVLTSLAELPAGVDVLDVFRRAEWLPAHADELLALPMERRPKVVWLQSGIVHDEVASRLAAAGMDVVQDRCLGVYTRRYRRH